MSTRSNKKPIRILCDMDGVLVNFDHQYEKINGVSPDEVYRSINSSEDKVSKSQMYKTKDVYWNRYVDEKGFVHAEPMGDAAILVEGLANLLKSGDIYRVEICTSAGGAEREADVRPQKIEWLNKHGFRDIVAHIVVNGKEKAKVIDEKYRDILIDDTKKVVDHFLAAGGEAILHEKAEKTLSILKNML